MSEKTNDETTTWSESLRQTIERWKENNPGNYDIFMLVVKDESEANAISSGTTKIIAEAMIGCMADESEENIPGSLMRIAAMQHFVDKAQPIGVEIGIIPISGNKETEEPEPANDESHE